MLKGKGLLTPIQRRCLTLFASLPDQERFYLTGGTALAEFHLGHRLSLDLDLFTAEEGLIVPFSHALESRFSAEKCSVTTIKRFATHVELELSEGEEKLRLDLGLDSPFRLEPPLLSEYGVWVNGYQDLVIEKMLAYYGRTEPRDAVDLYFILQRESPEKLLSLASRKDPGFDMYWFAVALNKAENFPDELDRWPVKMLEPFQPQELKRRFRDLALDLMERLTHS